MKFWLDIEQRRALRTWALVLTGAALVIYDAWAVYLLTYAFAGASAGARIIWIGTIAETNAALIGIVILTYAAEISIRSLSGTRNKDGSVSFAMSGNDAAPAVTATVQNAAGDSATASVPTAPDPANG